MTNIVKGHGNDPPSLYYGLVIVATTTVGALFSLLYPIVYYLNDIPQNKGEEFNLGLALFAAGLLILAVFIILIGFVTVILFYLLLTRMSKGYRGFVFLWALLFTLSSSFIISRVGLSICFPFSIFLLISSIILMILLAHPTNRIYFNNMIRNRAASQRQRTDGLAWDGSGRTGSVEDLIEQNNLELK